MHAWLCENPTGIDALNWKELPTPQPKAGEVLLEIAEASAAQVDAAVQAADRAFANWGRTTPKSRAECLLRLADTIEANADTLARLGGDEFVALLPGCDAAAAMHMADKLLAELARGIELEDGPTLPAEISILQKKRDATWLRVVLREGRKRQLRR